MWSEFRPKGGKQNKYPSEYPEVRSMSIEELEALLKQAEKEGMKVMLQQSEKCCI
jgi:ribosomal protein L29